MEILAVIGIMCFIPLLLVAFGYWLGRGAPGWPWAVVRRDGQQPASVTGRQVYYDREEYQR